MKRSPALLAVALAAALSACGDAGSDTPPEEPLRGVLLFTVDTLRADRLSAYGGAVPTPAFARLGEESLVFERAYSQGCNTFPSLTSMLTGLVPPRHGVLNQVGKMDPDIVTLPMMLRSQGVRTGSFVANLCKLQDVPDTVFNEGWEERMCGMLEGKPQHEWDQAVTDAGLAWVREAHATGEPWFAWIHLMDPHEAWQPLDAYWDHEAQPLRARIEQARHYAALEEAGGPSPEELERLHALYAAEVRGSDDQLARVLELLDELPGGDDVALVVSADHGEELFETWPRVGHGYSMTEGVLRVPLLLRVPGVRPARSDACVETLSVTPTVLQLLGLEAPYDLDGPSLFDPARLLPYARSYESGWAVSVRTTSHRLWLRTVARVPGRDAAAWRLDAPWFTQAECLAEYAEDAPRQPVWLDPAGLPGADWLAPLREAARAAASEGLFNQVDPGEITDPAYLEQLRELGYL